METYISILRGINVSGQKKIQMTDLKALYEKLKFRNIVTYIQSGNVVFKADKSSSGQHLSKRIEQAIFEKYNFEVPVIVRTLEEIRNAIAVNPFLKRKGIDLEKLHLTFLEEMPRQAELDKIKSPGYLPDEFVIINKEVYLYCPNGYGITKLSNNFFENKLKVKATTRNWRTVNKLAELAGNS